MEKSAYSYFNEENEIETDWKNPPKLIDLKNDLLEAKPIHEKHIKEVNDCLSTLRADFKMEKKANTSRIQPKHVRKQNEWKYASLEEPFLATNNLFKVLPVSSEDVESAKQNELILNKQFRVDIKKVRLINKLIRTAVNIGTVVIKLNWITETGIAIEEESVFTETIEELEQYLIQLINSGQISQEEAQQILMSGQPIQIGKRSVEVEKEIVNKPDIQIRDSRYVIIDPSCEDNFDEARFIIDTYHTDLSSLKKDGRYKNLDKIDLDNSDDFFDEIDSFKFNDKARKKIRVYEYWGFWDIDDSGVTKPIVATWVNNTMIRLEENPYPDKKLPFVVIQYMPPNKNEIYGESDSFLLKDNQTMIGALVKSMFNLIGKNANAQQAIIKGALDPLNYKRFQEGLDFSVNPTTNDISKILYTTKIPEIPNSSFQLIQYCTQDSEALSGTKSFSSGITGDALGSSVGGIHSALDATAKRDFSILTRVSSGLIEVGQKIIAMNAVWLSDEEIIRITDNEFIAIKRSSLAGKFDLNLNISTSEIDNKSVSELAFIMQTLGNKLPTKISLLILSKIAEIRNFLDISKILLEYEEEPNPLAQKEAELRISLLEAQIEEVRAKTEEHKYNMQLKDAKSNHEYAKAGLTTSKKDSEDLNYLNNATGLNQDRELEKINNKNNNKNNNKESIFKNFNADNLNNENNIYDENI